MILDILSELYSPPRNVRFTAGNIYFTAGNVRFTARNIIQIVVLLLLLTTYRIIYKQVDRLI